MANVNYYLGPWVWNGTGWEYPAGTLDGIDLRNLTHMGQSVTPNGVGFFATTATLGAEYDLLGQGDLRDINSTGQIKTTWLGAAGYTPKGSKLVDLLYDHLVFGSDPTGADDCKPLLPDANNALSIHLAGHSRVITKSFRVGHSPESNRVVAVLKEDYKKIRLATIAGDYPPDTHRKVLGYWARQFKVKRPQDVFIPGSLPKEDPLPPSTTATENFDGGDAAAVGKQLTWIEGGGVTDEWENRDSAAMRVTRLDGFPAIERMARCTSAVSSADHECSIVCTSMGVDPGTNNKNTRVGVAIRYSSTVDDCYFLGLGQTATIGQGPTTLKFPGKVIAGSETSFGNTTEVHNVPFTLIGKVVGSTLEMFINGDGVYTKTDTAVTGNLFGGIFGLNNNEDDDVQLDDWSITDDFPVTDSAAPLMMEML